MGHVVLKQMHIEKKLENKLNSMYFPKEESKKLSQVLDNLLNDEEVLTVMDTYTEAFIADIVTNTQSEQTSKLDETLKQQVKKHANEFHTITDNLISEKQIIAILTTTIDAADVQAMFDVSLHIMKEEIDTTQLMLLKILYFLKGNICHYVSQIGMLFFSLLLALQEKGSRGLTSVWLCGCIMMFVMSQTIPQLLTNVFANTKVAAALQDNIAQLERYTLILGAISLALVCVSLLETFIKKKIKRLNN